jgi:hypothetical protein
MSIRQPKPRDFRDFQFASKGDLPMKTLRHWCGGILRLVGKRRNQYGLRAYCCNRCGCVCYRP